LTGPDVREADIDLPLLRATMRVNTLIFGAIFGLLAGLILFALALAAALAGDGHARLVVTLLGVFLPGYAPGGLGALAGLLWGTLVGGAIAACVYRINCGAALTRVDELVALERGDDFPAARLRLHGPWLGLAVGTIGAVGLVVTTNWLVLRGTAGESVHARLLAQFLPGYEVDPRGSIVGAAELFVLLYLSSIVLAYCYNRIVDARHRGER
jgi:hypothetical protein